MTQRKLLVAVSGGVDSVVLLDRLVKERAGEITVAHFDHGIRPDSAADARFVEGLAKRSSLPFVVKREDLGANAGEDQARNRRYAFLRSEAKKRDAVIVTAHHADDIVETIAINIYRGTGWRGLAGMNAQDIARPLMGASKQDILQYAVDNRLEWVEDSTNESDKYLRNRIRRTISSHLETQEKEALLSLWRHQMVLVNEIRSEARSLLGSQSEFDRHVMIMVDNFVAVELLRELIQQKTGVSLTRPQAERALIAVKTARAGSIITVGSHIRLRFSQRTFIVEPLRRCYDE